jgi:predicted dehydrogenase
MENRREFLKTIAMAAAVSRAVPVLGANDRVRVGVIGTGNRGTLLARYFATHAGCELVAACDVRKSRLEALLKEMPAVGGGGDYRRILDRPDIDAVVVATPDHWHGPMIAEACAAGKDVYVEKPLTHTVEDAVMAVEAAKKHRRVVQLGIQQRSGRHYLEAVQLVQDGLLGKVTHAVLIQPGSYAQPMAPVEPPPPDLDWEMFQGPAPRHPYSPTRLRWRGFYDYGGGLITDWGVHLVETALLALRADAKTPLHATASAQYVAFPRDLEQLPDAFSCSWQYDDFVMSFTNAVPPSPDFGQQGTYLYGAKGVLHTNRSGYRVLPYPPKKDREGKVVEPAIDGRVVTHREEYDTNDPSTIAHIGNFLDSVKSRKSPVADITTVGFNATLPCLLARLAVKEGKAFRWNGTRAIPV